MSWIHEGDKVTHDFSGGEGTVVQVDPDPKSKYRYHVMWGEGNGDWYEEGVLIKVVE